MLYTAAACLVAAQLMGLYALKSRKADLVYSMFMVVLVLASVMFGYIGAKQQLG